MAANQVSLMPLPDFIRRGPAGYESVYCGINITRSIHLERAHQALQNFVLIGPILNKIQPFKNLKIY